MKRGHHHAHSHHGNHGHHHHRHQAGLAPVLGFLQNFNLKYATLTQQLQQPEFQSIHPVLSGELKAVETLRNEFIVAFGLDGLRKAKTEASVDEPETPPEPEGEGEGDA